MREATHCYDYEFGQVDERWQVQNENSSQTAEAYRACLGKHGLPTTGTLEQMVKEARSAGIGSIASC